MTMAVLHNLKGAGTGKFNMAQNSIQCNRFSTVN
jgi:hypothetical protein